MWTVCAKNRFPLSWMVSAVTAGPTLGQGEPRGPRGTAVLMTGGKWDDLHPPSPVPGDRDEQGFGKDARRPDHLPRGLL